MHAPTPRYFAFVSQFVNAVTTCALDEAFQRARAARRLNLQTSRATVTTLGVVPSARAA